MNTSLFENSEQKEFDYFATSCGFEKIFNSSYSKAYALFSLTLSSILKKTKRPLNILDIGCGDGWTAEFIAGADIGGTYLGIDTSEESIKKLNRRIPYERKLKVSGVVESAEWLALPEASCEIRKMLGGAPDIIICNTACHQIRKSYPDIYKIFAASGFSMGKDGILLVGDYYYPEDLADDEVETDRNWIKSTTGQTPTPRTGFITRSEMELILKNAGFASEYVKEVRANRDISLIYYLFQLKINVPKALVVKGSDIGR
jgi:SAM-dependent methyltransferase